MTVVTFGIMSAEEGLRGFADAFEAARLGRPLTPRTGVYFTSLEAARRFLTPKRLELLRLIRQKSPRSLYRLAKLAGRSFPAVFHDVKLLSKHGLLQLTREKGVARPSIRPRVGYDAIQLQIAL